METKNLLDYFAKCDNLYVYGAGKFAKEVIIFCRRNKIEIKGIIVTDKTNNPQDILGIQILGLGDINGMEESKINLVVAIAGNVLEIKNSLLEYDFYSVYYLPGKLYGILQRDNAAMAYENASGEFFLERGNQYIEPSNTIVCEKNTMRRLCRAEWGEISRYPQVFLDKCSFEELKNIYGDIYYVPHEAFDFTVISSELQNDNNIELYAVTSHLDNSVPEKIREQGFIPIQVGAALASKRKDCLGDDCGENISCRNSDYSECTALYWLWKNTSNQSYVGLNHYRRRLSLNDESINYIIKEKLDIVTAIPHFSYEVLNTYFKRFIMDSDWELMKKYAVEYDALYAPCIATYECAHYFFPCNIALFKREVFDLYCEFAFYVSEKIFSHYKAKRWVRNDRYMGYIFENLENLFILRHKDSLRKGYSDVMWVD